MAQVSRAMKRAFLQACPANMRARLLSSYPNLRKAAPEGMHFVFPDYYSDLRVHIDTRYKAERIMWSGLYEPQLIRFLESREKTPGWVCLDIGANVGAIALPLARLCGPGSKVYAFEPGPPNCERLRQNLELNPELLSRIEIIASGMGSRRGQLWWAEESKNPGNALLTDHGTHKVPVDTIDDFVRERGLSRIDFAKIDVEGMELEVMRGGKGALLRWHPILYFETLPRYVNTSRGSSFADLETFLAGECGYVLHKIGRDGQLEPIKARRFGGSQSRRSLETLIPKHRRVEHP